ncbi:MAG TPA: MTH938/NDUFAF3 family protein [Acidimicrobiales bacterium]|nr:MTH938/NDUFAF3 family protein [Acidimicrobiales bacterium]
MSSTSAKVADIRWGKTDVEGLGSFKDVKLWPGGGREWNWLETGTRHEPGVLPADVQELVDHGAQVIVLSRGMELRLQTSPETLELLEDLGVEVHTAETRAAAGLYNRLAERRPVGCLIHSTC